MSLNAVNGTLKRYVPNPLTQSKGFDPLSTIPYITVGLLAALFLYRYLTPEEKGGIRQLGGLPILSAWAFFAKRYDFVWANFGRDLHFRFKVFHHNVIVVRGEEARKIYFNTRSLSFNEGYRLLAGEIPRLEDISIEESLGDDVHKFNKRFPTIFNRDHIGDMIPHIAADLGIRTATWGKQGQIDPFQEVYTLIFQWAVRMTTCAELSQNFKEVEDIRKLYAIVEDSSTASALLLPWLPSPARRRKDIAMQELFTKLHHYVELRRNAAVSTNDSFDILLAAGWSNSEIIEFALATILPAVDNTGVAACQGLFFLALYVEWKEKAKAEVNSFIEKHTPSTSSDPLHKRLASIPISAWENELPVLNLVLKETLRHNSLGLILRRNVLHDITLAGGLVKPGDFVAYPLADVHMNADIYSRPDEFDPSRFAPGREEGSKDFAFVGWGVGRHVCTGKKFAKQEINMVWAYMLIAFDFDIVDKFGKRPPHPPKLNHNGLLSIKPIGDPCYLKFKRVVE